jgi:hypothetical protein
MHTLLQHGLCAEGGTKPSMDKETRGEAIALRSLLPYYESTEEKYFYLARDAALTRAAESTADLWDSTPTMHDGSAQATDGGASVTRGGATEVCSLASGLSDNTGDIFYGRGAGVSLGA